MTEVTDKVERADRPLRARHPPARRARRTGPRRRAARTAAAELGPRRAASARVGVRGAASSASSPSSSAFSFRSACSASWLRSVWRSASRALLAFTPSETRSIAGALARSSQRRDGPALRFLPLTAPAVRLPAPAQAEIDGSAPYCRRCKQTLERVETLDPNAQDARRLMSIHLPGLIDRYLHVPAAYRSERDGEDKTRRRAAGRGPRGGSHGSARNLARNLPAPT